ncbi:hypothetical protein DQK91_23705, partial [Oceanidesulfovibrio marinus]
EYMDTGAEVMINLTKCPDGTIFIVFKNGKKLGEINGGDDFFSEIGPLLCDDWDAYKFFAYIPLMT